MKRYFIIFFALLGILLLNPNSAHAELSTNITSDVVKEHADAGYTVEVNTLLKDQIKPDNTATDLQWFETEVEEEEEEVKKKLISSCNWESDAAMRNANLSLSGNVNLNYSSPQCNSLIIRSSLRLHVTFSIFLI